MTGASALNKTKNLLVPIFAIQEYWSGLPFLSPGNLPDPVMELTCPALQGIFSAEPLGSQRFINFIIF